MWYALKSGSKMCFNCLKTFISFIESKAPCKYAQTIFFDCVNQYNVFCFPRTKWQVLLCGQTYHSVLFNHYLLFQMLILFGFRRSLFLFDQLSSV